MPKHHSKLVNSFSKKLQELENSALTDEEKFEKSQKCLIYLAENLVTFGPGIEIIHFEYEKKIKKLNRNILIEQKCKEITEQKLHDVLETKSNSSSGMLSPRNMLSPRPSLANWSPFEKLKSKIKILENTKQEFKSKIEEQEKEKNELISHLRQSKLENQKLQEKVKDLGDSYEMFKTSMVSQEDPFVLRLALEQSRKDFTKVVEELNTLKENYQSGFFVSQLEYDKLEVQLQQANKTIKKLQELNNKYETEKQNLFEAMNASKEDYSAYKDEKLKPLMYL